MSEIAAFRQQQEREEQSTRLGLFGPAATASHDAIITRMQAGAETLLQLIQAGRGEEALALWDTALRWSERQVQL